jgi:hypothetical protein
MSSDPVQSTVKGIIEAIYKPIEGIVKTLAGPAAEEIGLSFRDSVQVWRLKRQVRLFERVQIICDDAGIKPQSVKLSLLFDVVERATLEEDDELQNLWANLLANAADPGGQVRVRTTFPDLLRHISKEEAIYLNEMFEINEMATAYTGRAFLPQTDEEMEVSLPPKRLDEVSYDNLKRLGLIVENDETVPIVPLGIGVNQFRFLTTERYSLSSLGVAFVTACGVPKSLIKPQSL